MLKGLLSDEYSYMAKYNWCLDAAIVNKANDLCE